MKSLPDANTTPDQKMQRFEAGLGRVLLTSKKDLQAMLASEKPKKRKRGRPRVSASSARASRAKR